MQPKLSLLLPTRGRPLLVKRLFNSIIRQTTNLNDLEIVLCLDEDDIESHKIENRQLNIVKTVGPPTTMGAYNTRCYKASSGDFVMLMNDDLTVETPGWDRLIIDFAEKIPDSIFLAYPDDMEKANLSTFPIISRKTCIVLEKPYPEEYEDTFIDDHLFDVFTRLKQLGYNRIFYLPEIKLDHRHFIDGKVRPDASYIHKNRYKDSLIFLSLRSLRQVQAIRLNASIEGMPLPKLQYRMERIELPKNLWQIILLYGRLCFSDKGLPFIRRLRWFIRFSKYYAAMKSGISFLKAKTYTLYGSG